MRKLIAGMNITLDGYCDHTAGIPSAELHDYYTEQLKNAGALLYGRVTYQLMEDAWPEMVKNPTGIRNLDDFAKAIDDCQKIIFSRTLKSVSWKNTTLAQGSLENEVIKLKQQSGNELFVGSPSLIAQLTQAGLIDEYRICIHPVILGSGRVLFKDILNSVPLKLIKTQTIEGGVVTLWYERA